MRHLQTLVGFASVLLMQGQAARADRLPVLLQCGSGDASKASAINAPANRKSAIKKAVCHTTPVTSYAVRYERYGVLGLYHVSLRIDELRDGVQLQRFHIDGAGRPTKLELNLNVCKLKFRLPPVHLAAYINPQGYKKHFLGLLASNEFGPIYTLNQEQGAKLIVMAHHAMTNMNNSDELLYFTFPFRIGPLQFWTSNSIVASLVRVANQQGIKVGDPVDGCYPGFKGPFLAKSYFQ